jgi:TnpA family transposase
LNARKANEYAAYLRKLMTTTAPVNDAILDKFKDVEHPEYLARALVERGLTEQAVKVLYWIRSDNAYRYL